MQQHRSRNNTFQMWYARETWSSSNNSDTAVVSHLASWLRELGILIAVAAGPTREPYDEGNFQSSPTPFSLLPVQLYAVPFIHPTPITRGLSNANSAKNRFVWLGFSQLWTPGYLWWRMAVPFRTRDLGFSSNPAINMGG